MMKFERLTHYISHLSLPYMFGWPMSRADMAEIGYEEAFKLEMAFDASNGSRDILRLAPDQRYAIGDRHAIPVLEAASALCGQASGTHGGLMRDAILRMHNWLLWRVGSGWEPSAGGSGHPLRLKLTVYENAVRTMAIAALNVSEDELFKAVPDLTEEQRSRINRTDRGQVRVLLEHLIDGLPSTDGATTDLRRRWMAINEFSSEESINDLYGDVIKQSLAASGLCSQEQVLDGCLEQVLLHDAKREEMIGSDIDSFLACAFLRSAPYGALIAAHFASEVGMIYWLYEQPVDQVSNYYSLVWSKIVRWARSDHREKEAAMLRVMRRSMLWRALDTESPAIRFTDAVLSVILDQSEDERRVSPIFGATSGMIDVESDDHVAYVDSMAAAVKKAAQDLFAKP